MASSALLQLVNSSVCLTASLTRRRIIQDHYHPTTPLVLLILSSFCRRYINPLCSDCLASGMRWTECIGSIRLVLECTLPLHIDWVYPLSGWCSITFPVSLVP